MKTLLFLLLFCSATTLVLADDSYFPIATKAGTPGLSAFESQWYGKSLQRMDEPRLPAMAQDATAEVYRLLILPTWGNSIAVRVSKRGSLYSLSARRLDGQAGYDPGKLIETKDMELSLDDSKALGLLIQSINFFQLPTASDISGNDGDEWILEGVSNGKYHVVQRWCAPSYNPEKRKLTAFVALCKFLLDKSALSERPLNKGHQLL